MMKYNYLITYSRKYRLNEDDYLVHGDRCKNIIKSLLHKIKTYKQNEKDLILLRNVERLFRMTLNARDNELYITKFVDPTWDKAVYFSNIGEKFQSLNDFFTWYPYTKPVEKNLLAEKNIDKILKI